MRSVRFVAATAALLTFTGLAQAQAPKSDGVYLSVGGGRSDLDVDCAGTTTCDNSGSALRLNGGWRSGTLGFEGIVLRFGTAKASVAVGGVPVSVELKNEMVGGGVALFGPFSSNFDGVVRLGLASVKTSASGSVGNQRADVGSESKARVYAGLGVVWRISPAVYLEANWDSTKSTFDGESGNVSALTVAVGFKF